MSAVLLTCHESTTNFLKLGHNFEYSLNSLVFSLFSSSLNIDRVRYHDELSQNGQIKTNGICIRIY